MSNCYHPRDNSVFLHGCYVPPDFIRKGSDAIVACVKDIMTGESHLHIIRNPMTQDYVLREGLRNFEHKREYARLSDCDMYIVPYKDQYVEIANKLEPRKRYTNEDAMFCKRLVEKSPYTFGWDISPMVRMKVEYMEHTPKDPTNLKVAILDIETSVLEDNPDEILALSVCDWPTRTVHCFILNGPWLRAKDTAELEARTIPAYSEFVDGLNDKAKKEWDTQPVRPVYHLCKDERDLLVQSFQCIHQLRPDFLGVWNMGFDIPHIIKRAEFRQLDVTELFNYPEVPKELHYFQWHEDKTSVDHFTDVWHTVQVPGYTYYYDAMCLYSRIRKVQGRDVSYTLDYIGNLIIGSGKMHFGANQSHYLMQTNDKVGYCVYNTIDTIIPALMNAVTHDVDTMVALSDCSMLDDFAKQTVQLKAQFYRYLKDQGKIPGACAGSMAQEYDECIGNIGGAVLNPSLMKVRGVAALQESDERTAIYKLAADLDVSSFYPSATIAINVSRETKISTLIWVEGCPYTIQEIQDELNKDKQKLMAKANATYIDALCGLVPFVDENSVHIGHQYFGLPDYQEMLDLYHNDHPNGETP